MGEEPVIAVARQVSGLDSSVNATELPPTHLTSSPVATEQAVSAKVRSRLDPRHWLALVMCLLCLLPLGAHQVLLARSSSARLEAATGDPLLDTVLLSTSDFLATANAQQRATAIYMDTGQNGVSAYLNKSVVQSKWRDDPRWWELSYQLRANLARAEYLSTDTSPGSAHSPEAKASMDAAEEVNLAFLKRCQLEGKASPPLLFVLLKRLESRWDRESMQSNSIMPDTKEGRANFLRNNRAITRKPHGAEEQELLAAMRRLDPDNAMSYYWEAGMEAIEGRHAEALELVTQGNALPLCQDYALFPLPELQHAAAQGGSLLNAPVSAALNSIFTDQVSSMGIRGYIALGRSFMHFAKASDERALTELQRGLARLGSQASDQNAARVVANTIDDCLSAALPEARAGRLSTPQAALGEVDLIARQQLTALTNFNATQANSFMANISTPEMALTTGVALLDNGQSMSIQMSKAWWQQTVTEQQFLTTQLAPQWEKLAQFNYASLSP